MKNKLFYFLLAGLLLRGPIQSAHAQTYIKKGANVTSTQDFNYSICTSNNLYISSGTTMNTATNSLDISVTCRDAVGNIIWNSTYDINSGNADFSGKIRPTPDGVIIVGTTGGEFGQPKNIFALHLDFSGNILGQAIYTTPNPAHINTYGFDVVFEPSDGSFVIVGMADYNVSNIEAEKRFGLIMKVSNDLQTVFWSNQYMTSPPGFGPYYDCINDIERVSNGAGIYYYLTGSITDYIGGSPASLQQGVFNMLVDNTGAQIWDNPFDASNAYDRGSNALYDDANNILYLLHNNSETHTPNIATINFATGAVMNNTYIYVMQLTDDNAYAIEWSDNTHTNIVMHGIIDAAASNCNVFASINYLIELNPANFSSFVWQKTYLPGFATFDLSGVSYDWVLKPEYLELSPIFFVPHTFVPNYTINNVNPYYTIIGTTESSCGSGTFDNLAFQTDNNGNFLSDQCYTSQPVYTFGTVNPVPVTQGNYNPYPMLVLQPNVTSMAPPRNEASACPYMPKHSNTNAVAQVENKAFNLYPDPATDMINVVVPAGTVVKSIYIVDALGNKIDYSNAVSGGDIQLNIANLAAGVYYMQLTTGDEIKHFKFVKE